MAWREHSEPDQPWIPSVSRLEFLQCPVLVSKGGGGAHSDHGIFHPFILDEADFE